MTIDPRVLDLLERWEQLGSDGHSITVDELCAEAPELRDEVAKLIQQIGQADAAFVSTEEWQPTESSTVPSQRPEDPVTLDSKFEDLRPHARGGLGEVLIASDETLRRKVALKRIQKGSASSTQGVNRFVREARITAQLEHPGIVPVHGIGKTSDGRPCYVMRFIEGQTLRLAIEQFHQRGGLTSRETEQRIEFRRLLQRFHVVCQTISYAHSRGVVHRDIKPDNIMLGPYGETLVVDWGLAKELRSSADGETTQPSTAADEPNPPDTEPNPTADGAVMGTPAYMSPEQATGNTAAIGPAADIYSLGATLYHLLTGRPAFERDSVAVILQRIARHDFAPPCAVQPAVPRALEAICLKAMALAPTQRYRDASELAADVDRWLADEPVSCRRDGFLVRWGRWARRHRTLSAGVGALLVSAVIFLVVLIVVIDRSRRRSEEERHRTTEARDAETRAKHRTRQAMDTATDEILGKYLGRGSELDEEDKAFLRKVLDHYVEFATESGNDRETRTALARAHVRIGRVNELLGNAQVALEQHQQAVALFQELEKDQPDDSSLRRARADALAAISDLAMSLGNRDLATLTNRESFALREQLANNNSDDLENQLTGVRAYSRRAGLHFQLGEFRQALADYQQARRLITPLKEKHVTNYPVRWSFASILVGIGHGYRELGSPKEAITVYREAVAEWELFVANRPTPSNRNEFARLWGSLALAYSQAGQGDDAFRSSEQAITIREALVQAHPNIPEYRANLGVSYINLASDFLRKKQLDRADLEKAFELRGKAVKTYQELVKLAGDNVKYRHQLAVAHVGLAMSYRRDKNDVAKAKEELTAAQQLFKGLVMQKGAPDQHLVDYAECQLQFALIHIGNKAYAEAVANLQPSIQLLEGLIAKGSPSPDGKRRLTANLANLAFCFQETGEWHKAIAAQSRVFTLRIELARDHPNIAEYQVAMNQARFNLAAITYGYLKVEAPEPTANLPVEEPRWRQARLALLDTLAPADSQLPPIQSIYLLEWVSVARLQENSGNAKEAVKTLQKALEIGKELVHRSPTVADYQNNFGWCWYRLGKLYLDGRELPQARDGLEQARSIFETMMQKFPTHVLSQSNLALVLETRGSLEVLDGKPQSAEKDFRSAIDHQKQAVKRDEKSTNYRNRLNEHYRVLGDLLRREQRIAEAIAVTVERKNLFPKEPAELVTIGMDLAKCVVGSDNPEMKRTPEQDKVRKEAIDHTLVTLRQAQALGFNDWKLLEQEPAFQPAQKIAEFQKFLEDVRKGKP